MFVYLNKCSFSFVQLFQIKRKKQNKTSVHHFYTIHANHNKRKNKCENKIEEIKQNSNNNKINR